VFIVVKCPYLVALLFVKSIKAVSN
jgi:hypothetical protein